MANGIPRVSSIISEPGEVVTAKLNFDKITPEVAKRVLVFLNCATSAKYIAGVERQDGPVFDDPNKGRGDQKDDYDIGLTVAQRILDKRDGLPDQRFSDVTQLDNIKGLGQDKLDDLVHSFGPKYYGQCRNIYLRIEEVENYSPVEPQTEKVLAPVKYKRDCLRNPGHPDGIIPDAEADARTMTGLVYREYLDPDYLVPKPAKLVNADINEPLFDRRVPGALVYTKPGETLCIHVFNSDDEPHSFHLHALEYGPDSDGSYPLGTQSADGRRSDEICPGQEWTYVFKVKEDHIGCWPFHSHYKNTGQSVNRGLFGGVVVLPNNVNPPPERQVPVPFKPNGRLDILGAFGKAILGNPRNDLRYRYFVEDLHEWAIGDLVRPPFKEKVHHVPLFFHEMNSGEGKPLFESGDLEEIVGVFEHTFEDEGSFGYFCEYHPNMTGTVEVVPAAPALVTVNILDAPEMNFYPPLVQVAPGGVVRWENHSDQHHTVTSSDGAVMPTHCINGRGFIGNSPTIEANTGEKIRWYVFNLDFGHNWHNFHPHNSHWKLGDENLDVRSMGPAESFCLETTVPTVVLSTPKIDAMQKKKTRPKNAKQYTFEGEYIFHCHVHHHLMNGMVGMIRAKQTLWLTPEVACELMEDRGLRLYTGNNLCPPVEMDRCKKSGEGHWEEVPGDPRVAMMHACVLPKTSKLLYFGYESRYIPNEHEYSWLWDEVNGYHMTQNQLADITAGGYTAWSMWSGEHTFLDDDDGTILIHGGYRTDVKKAYLFDPQGESWSATAPTAFGRFYATTLTLSDGSAITLYGSNLGAPGTSFNIEQYDPAAGTWGAAIPLPPAMNVHQYYPWTYLCPDGQLFIAGPHVPTHRFDMANPAVFDQFGTVYGDRSSTGGEKGTSVMFTLRPPNYEVRVMIIGGNTADAGHTSEIIDLSQPMPAWESPTELELNVPRPFQCHSILLPDGRVMLCGGVQTGPDGGPVEIFDPEDPASGWKLGPVMTHKRTYHSSAVMIPDGSVIAGGDPAGAGSAPTPHERYYPDYFTAPRPQISNAPLLANYGTSITIDTPQAALIGEVALMRPAAMTHGWNMSQRRIELEITNVAGTSIDAAIPANANVVPPGWYLIYVLDGNRVPSEGHWIRITN